MADCPKCGLSIMEGMKFCPECGANLSELIQPKPLEPPAEPIEKGVEMEPKQEPLPPPEQEVPWNQQVSPPAETPRQDMATEVQPPVKTKSKKLVYTVLAVIIAAVVIFAALYFGFRGSEDNPFASITDTDGDGYNDDIDAFINDKNEWKDTDNDGVGDNGDAFPNDPNETLDTDGDGHGDNGDEFPNDPDEWEDSDGDGVGDNGDAFPNDPNEQYDADNDGVGDNSDAFPNDSTQWADRDGDGYGDNPNGINPDAFPDDPTEWKDSDSDNIGDNADIYDNGNGGIYFKVLFYDGDGYPDDWGDLDPYFTIWIDLNDNYEIDTGETSQSEEYSETDQIYNPHSWVVDVPDDTEHVSLGVWVYDYDFWDSDDVIDTSPSPDDIWVVKGYNPATESNSIEYNCDGRDDDVDSEANAYIECEYGVQKMT